MQAAGQVILQDAPGEPLRVSLGSLVRANPPLAASAFGATEDVESPVEPTEEEEITREPQEAVEQVHHMWAINCSTRSSTLRNGSLHSTVRWAWSFSFKCTQSTV